MEPYTKKGIDLFIKKCYTSLSDSLWPFESIKNLTFLQTDNIKFFTADLNRRGFGLFVMNIRIDLEYDIYTRSIYSMSDILRDIGGFQSSLLVAGSILVSLFSEKLLYARLVRDMYQTKPSRSE